jgi:Xaa-Pro dipeptidase
MKIIEHSRIDKLKNRMKGNADYALISPSSNLYYLTGIDPVGTGERLFLLVVSPESSPFILAPLMYKNELESIQMEFKTWEDDQNPYMLLEKEIDTKKKPVFAIEDSLPVGTFFELNRFLKGGEFKSISTLMSELRILKDNSELESIRGATAIVDRTFSEILDHKLLGMSEVEVADLITELIKKHGGEGGSFDPIVASGPNGANPHHRPTAKKIEKGELVVLDYGAKYNHYCSDITRTIGIDSLSDEAKIVSKTVLEAQENAFQKTRTGARAKDIDSEARKHIDSRGFGKYFIHRTGHGLGLDVHEPPYINSTSDTLLENNMVFTIEPGIYLPGKFGVRIEDDILISDTGKRLTKADRELMII